MRALLAVLLLLTFVPAASPAAGDWRMRDLGTLGGRYSMALDVNDAGVVAGTSRIADKDWPHARHVFVWKRGRITDAGYFGPDSDSGGPFVLDGRGGVAWMPTNEHGVYSNGRQTVPLPVYPMAANAQGVVAGVAGRHAALWSGGRTRDLGTLPGDAESSARAIDDSGVVAGDSGPWQRGRAFVWRRGKLTALVTPKGYAWCEAALVNARAHVVGVCGAANGSRRRSFLWRAPSEAVLVGWQETRPVALTDDDTVVGEIPSRWTRGFVWRDGHLKPIGTLGGRQTFVYDANDRGQVVGSSYTASGNLHAFVWQDGVMTDLARQGRLSLSEAFGINSRGDVVGYSRTGEPSPDDMTEVPKHAVLWTRA